MMFQSRCGVACDECTRKEAVGCRGCLAMAQPFWGGECAVKSCVEGRSLDHCGRCPEFPCQVLSEMGKDQGFDPQVKIEACRRWAQEQQS